MDSIATGKIMCSIIEAANLRHSLAVKRHANQIFHPYVKISVEQFQQGFAAKQIGKEQISAPSGLDKKDKKAQE